MGKPATQTGAASEEQEANVVTDPETGEEIVSTEGDDLEDEEPPMSDRDKMMRDLALKRKEENARENGSDEEDQDDLEDEDLDEEPPADDDSAEDEMVTLKVDGEEIQRTKAEVDAAGGVAAIQKTLSGERKLEQAAAERKTLDADREQLRQDRAALDQAVSEVKQLQTTQAQAGTQDTPEAKEKLKQKAKEITEKFFSGDAEELQEAVETILAKAEQSTAPAPAATAPLNEDAVVARATQNVRFEMEQSQAITDFEEKHSDLNSPGRREYVNDRTKDVLREHPNWGPKKVIAEAVKLTRDQLNLPAPEKAPVLDPLKAKRQRKKATVDTVPSATQRGKPPTDTKKPKTPAQIVEEMKKLRSHQ